MTRAMRPVRIPIVSPRVLSQAGCDLGIRHGRQSGKVRDTAKRPLLIAAGNPTSGLLA
jgi:hypothetical protein